MGLAKRLSAMIDDGRISEDAADAILALREQAWQGREASGQMLVGFKAGPTRWDPDDAELRVDGATDLERENAVSVDGHRPGAIENEGDDSWTAPPGRQPGEEG